MVSASVSSNESLVNGGTDRMLLHERVDRWASLSDRKDGIPCRQH